MLIIVTARSGSKRLPNKNIKMLGRYPLFVHTLMAFREQAKEHELLFSTDSEDYIKLAEKYVDFKISYELRPSEYAQDKTKVVFEVERILNKRNLTNEDDNFILALPTAPLRDRKVVERFFKFNPDFLPAFSCVKYSFPVQFAFRQNNKSWKALLESSPMITNETRSQDIEDLYRPNGAIYLNNAKNFFESGLNLYKNCIPFEMSLKESTDVDDEIDFLIAESLLLNDN